MDDLARSFWIAISAFAGSITGYSFMPWQKMTGQERALAIIVGFSFAVFGVPWVFTYFMKFDLSSMRAACGAAYMGGAIANAVIPALIRRAKRTIDADDGEGPK